MSPTLSERVRLLLRDHVESYEQLEMILLLFRDPERDWSDVEVADRIKVDPTVAAEGLAHLADAGFAEPVPEANGRFRYARKTSWADALHELAAAYDTDRVNVINTMTENALERLRTLTARVFADAFRLRKGKNDG
jgi:hypothetical protein